MATEILRPNTGGTTTELYYYHLAVGGYQSPDSEVNWTEVDEVEQDGFGAESTKVATNSIAAWDKDTYNLSNPSGSGIINKITVKAYCQSNTSYVCQGKTVIRTHATDYEGTAVTWEDEASVEKWVTKEYTLNPNTGEPFTWAELASLEAGITGYVAQGAGNRLSCTQAYVEVDYTLALVPVSDGDLIGIGIIRKT